MRLAIPVRGVLTLLALSIACLYGTISGTEGFMNDLPVFEEARCLVCHESSGPTPTDFTLNPFGTDFKENEFLWNAELAAKDSDGDGYKNGDELGDPDGDGTTDVELVRSNPGDRNDKPSSIDEKTWGVIKQLFADN